MKRLLLLALIAAFAVASCDKNSLSGGSSQEIPENNDNDGNNGGEGDDPAGTGKDVDVDVTAEDDSLDVSEFDKAITIVWSAEGASVTNGSKLSVTKDGGHVVVGAAGAEGKKVRINLSGSCPDGSLKIYNGVKADDTNKKMLLSFEGLDLTSTKGPAINIQSGKTVFVLLKDGTQNSLCDAAVYTDTVEGEDAKGCFFSEKQLVFSGAGSLSVTGKQKHAISVDDYVHIFSGKISATTSTGDCLHSNEYVYIEGGEVTFNPKGLKGSGIECDSDILISGGKVGVTAEGVAAKCLKTDNNVTISGGNVVLKTTGTGVYDSDEKDTSAASCIRAENIVTLKGGVLSCTSTGNGGKGINCYQFVAEEGASATVKTSGGVYSYGTSKSRPKAVKATKLVNIKGGVFDITTTGTEGEGIESKDAVVIDGGSIVICAKDDAINAGGVITFNGGYTYAYSTGNDGIDTNAGKANSIVVNGGVVMTHSTNSPEEGFDADNHAYLTFKGGYVFCTGGNQGGGGMGGGGGRPGPSGGYTTSSNPSCSQPTLLWTTTASKGYFTLADSNGNVVMSCYVPRAMNSSYCFISAPMTSGKTYKCGFTTSAPSGATTVFGTYFYSDGTAPTLSKSFTAPSGYSTLK